MATSSVVSLEAERVRCEVWTNNIVALATDLCMLFSVLDAHKRGRRTMEEQQQGPQGTRGREGEE
jgi:hypothetical protein